MFRIPMIQLTNNMRLKEKGDQSVDSLVLLRRRQDSHRMKYRDKVREEPEGKVTQMWFHMWIHLIYNHPRIIDDAKKCLLKGA